MCKYKVLTVAVLLFGLQLSTNALATAAPVIVASPDGKIEVQIATAADGQLTWAVSRQSRPVLPAAPLGITIDGNAIGKAVTLGAPKTRTIDEKYTIPGNHAQARNYCNEAVIPIEAAGTKYELDVRAFDDGAAVRIRANLGDSEHKIADEQTSWALPPGCRAWWARYDNSYEANYQSGTIEEVPASTELAGPITFKLADDLYVAISEANNDSFPDMGLQREGLTFKSVFPASKKGWNQQGSITTPWRIAIVADSLNSLVNSDMLTNLCPGPPPELANAEWIKPGRALWHWWAIGAPKLNDQHDWVDAAKRLGFEYYLIDEGWRSWRAEGKDQWQCLKEVIDYGKSQGIGSLVWVNSSEMRNDTARREYLEKVASLGAVGIKIDFIPACTAQITHWYEGTLKDTAELHLMCDFHGAVKPTGRRRTWPHELTREAVRGLEYQMTRYRRVLPAEHDEIVLFTRFLAGPADYTPTTFNPRELVGYTWGHMLAQSVDMTSPLQHFGGGYKEFIDNPAEDFLRHLPTVWDETIVLPGSEIGQTAALARRRGSEWYVGVLNGKDARTLPIDLSFLATGDWNADLFADTPDNPAAFHQETKRVTAKDKLDIPLSVRGGAAIWFTKAAP